MERVAVLALPQVVKENLEVIKITSQEHVFQDRIRQRTFKQFAGIPASQVAEELSARFSPSQQRVVEREVPEVVSHDRIQRRTAEQIIDIPGLQVVEETNFDVFSHDRVQQRFVERNTVPQERNSERKCEQIEDHRSAQVPSQNRLLQRTLEQTLDESCVPCE